MTTSASSGGQRDRAVVERGRGRAGSRGRPRRGRLRPGRGSRTGRRRGARRGGRPAPARAARARSRRHRRVPSRARPRARPTTTARAWRHSAGHRAGEADGRPAEARELRGDRGGVTAPAGRVAGARPPSGGRSPALGLAVGDEPDAGVGVALDTDAEVERRREHEAAAVVDVLAEQVDRPGAQNTRIAYPAVVSTASRSRSSTVRPARPGCGSRGSPSARQDRPGSTTSAASAKSRRA